jgi:ubiquinone/menaquinone biosynthesis C-methylase UbiE
VGKMADIEAHESKLYSELAPVYDKVFGKIFYNRLERVIEDLDIPAGAKVLEVGAGTGTSFPAYPAHCSITGVDLAPDMLARAQRKIEENGWSHERARFKIPGQYFRLRDGVSRRDGGAGSRTHDCGSQTGM